MQWIEIINGKQYLIVVFFYSTKLDHKFIFPKNTFSGIRIISNAQMFPLLEVDVTLMIHYKALKLKFRKLIFTKMLGHAIFKRFLRKKIYTELFRLFDTENCD